jgi:DNA-directed RNA polymerase subunit RPC12/RpoP
MADTLSFKCTRCGSTKFEMPEKTNDSDVVKCAGCGAQGRYGEVKAVMVEQAKKHIEDVASKALGPLFKRR